MLYLYLSSFLCLHVLDIKRSIDLQRTQERLKENSIKRNSPMRRLIRKTKLDQREKKTTLLLNRNDLSQPTNLENLVKCQSQTRSQYFITETSASSTKTCKPPQCPASRCSESPQKRRNVQKPMSETSQPETWSR